jgi:type I restriction enzyme S subunit
LRGYATISAPYVTVVNVQDGHLDLSSVSETSLKLSELPNAFLQENDVLMTEGGDRDKLGRGVIWRGAIRDCAFQNHIFRVRLDSTIYRPRLFHYLIQTVDAKAYFYAHAKQTSNLCTINSRELARFEVAVPMIDEQDEMIRHLELVDAMVDAAVRERDAAHSLKQSLIADLLVGRLRPTELGTA